MSTLPSDIRKKVSKLPAVTQDVVAQRMHTVQVPVIYEEACKALAACTTVDEGKYWSDKATALAAWAKIHGSRKAEAEAARLKLHAFRRMGALALELRPPDGVETPQERKQREIEAKKRYIARKRGLDMPLRSRSRPGAQSLLIDSGLSPREAGAALRISRVEDKLFTDEVERQKPRSPTGLWGRDFGAASN